MSVMPLLEAPLRGGDGVFDEGVVVESDLDRDQMNHLSDSSPRAPEGRAGGGAQGPWARQATHLTYCRGRIRAHWPVGGVAMLRALPYGWWCGLHG